MKRSVLLFTFCFFCALLSAQWSYRAGFNSMYVRGDVEPFRDIVNGGELGASYYLEKSFYSDLSIGFGQMTGINRQVEFGSEAGGALVEEEYQGVGTNRLHANYKKNYGYADFGLSFKPSTSEGLIRFDIGGGLGFSISDTRTDIRDEGGDFYNARSFLSNQRAILENLDGEYETKFRTAKTFLPHLYLQGAISIDIAESVYLSIIIKAQLANSDHIDTISYQTAVNGTENNDSVRIIGVSFHYGLGANSF